MTRRTIKYVARHTSMQYDILHHKYLKRARLSIRFLSVLGGYNPKSDEDIYLGKYVKFWSDIGLIQTL